MAEQKLIIDVTSKHIKKGKLQEPLSCPIALATRGLKLRNVYVDGAYVSYTKGKKKFTAELPKRAVQFIEKFDDSLAVSPFSFTLKPYEVDENGEKVKAKR